MPVYEEAYRSWQGQLVERPLAWWVIARTGIRLVWRRVVLLLIILAAVPFMVHAGQIYILSRWGTLQPGGPQVDLPPELLNMQIDAAFFGRYLGQSTFLLVIMMIVIGAGLIANDRKFRALPLYFSKPVSFWDYFGGKAMVVAFYGGVITVLPAVLLFLMHVLLTEDKSFLQEYWWVLLSVAGWGVLALAMLGLLVLAMSGVAKGPRPASIYYFTLLMLPEIVRRSVPSVPEFGLFSPLALLRQSSSLLFGTTAPYPFSRVGAVIVLVVLVVAAGAVLRAQVRPTEVIR